MNEEEKAEKEEPYIDPMDAYKEARDRQREEEEDRVFWDDQRPV